MKSISKVLFAILILVSFSCTVFAEGVEWEQKGLVTKFQYTETEYFKVYTVKESQQIVEQAVPYLDAAYTLSLDLTGYDIKPKVILYFYPEDSLVNGKKYMTGVFPNDKTIKFTAGTGLDTIVAATGFLFIARGWSGAPDWFIGAVSHYSMALCVPQYAYYMLEEATEHEDVYLENGIENVAIAANANKEQRNVAVSMLFYVESVYGKDAAYNWVRHSIAKRNWEKGLSEALHISRDELENKWSQWLSTEAWRKSYVKPEN